MSRLRWRDFSPDARRFLAGSVLLELGHAFARSHTLMNQARPLLERLAKDVGETAHLGVLSGRQVVHLDGVLPDQLVLTGLRVGDRLDAHCTALGKALLAGELATRSVGLGAPFGGADAAPAPGGLEAELAGASLTRFTQATLCDPTKLVEDLRAIQLNGYATDLEEYAQGLCCVAAPVRDASARIVGALSLSGPAMRLDPERLHGPLATAIREAAAELSNALGFPAALPVEA